MRGKTMPKKVPTPSKARGKGMSDEVRDRIAKLALGLKNPDLDDDNGFSQLARKLGRRTGQVGEWINGKNGMHVDALSDFVRAGYSADYILTGTGSPYRGKTMERPELAQAVAAHVEGHLPMAKSFAIEVNGDRVLNALVAIAERDEHLMSIYAKALGAFANTAIAFNQLTGKTIPEQHRRTSATFTAQRAVRDAKAALALAEVSAKHLLDGVSGTATSVLRFRTPPPEAPRPSEPIKKRRAK